MNLQFKILLIIIPFLLLSLLILGLWSFNEAKNSTYRSTHRYLDIVLDSYTTDSLINNYQLLREAKMDKVKSYIESYQQEAENDARVISKAKGGHIFALNDSGQLVFSTHNHAPASLEQTWKHLSRDVALQNTDIIVTGQLEDEGYNNVYAARYFKPWGWVVFHSVPKKGIDTLVNTILQFTFGMIVLCAFGGSLIIYIFSKIYLVRPIDKLKDAATNITIHKKTITIAVDSKDEFGSLARSMEGMSQAIYEYKAERKKAENSLLEKQEELQKSRKELKRHRDSLEQLVEDRTFELNEINKQLQQEIIEHKQTEDELKKHREHLEEMVSNRTIELVSINKELEAFSYSVSHDLRAPLRGIDGWSLALQEDYASQLDEKGRGYLDIVRGETQRLGILIDDLLQLSRVTRGELQREQVDLSALALSVVERIKEENPDRQLEFDITPGLMADADPRLLEVVFTNLLGNACKFTSSRPVARIEIGNTVACDPASQVEQKVFFVRDNGVGFDMAHSDKLFGAFQRLHSASEFPGIGIGLATVQRIIGRHGCRIWAEAKPNEGASFYFTLEEAA